MLYKSSILWKPVSLARIAVLTLHTRGAIIGYVQTLRNRDAIVPSVAGVATTEISIATFATTASLLEWRTASAVVASPLEVVVGRQERCLIQWAAIQLLSQKKMTEIRNKACERLGLLA